MSETLVLLPEMMCDARAWSTVVTVMSYERPVLFAPVWRGDRIEEIASATLMGAPAKFALLGHGMGGVIALEMFRRAPERIMRLALLGTNPLSDTPQEAAAREPLMIAAKSGRFEQMLNSDVLPLQFGSGPERAAHMSDLLEMALALGPDTFVRQQRAMQRRRDQQSTLRRVTPPTLIVAGEEDRIVPMKRQEFLAELILYAKIERMAGVGHWPMLEDPEALLAILRVWMQQPLVLR